MDESNATCGKRLESIGLENTVENRQTYRELLCTTPGLGQYISGAILFEETLFQDTRKGTSMVSELNKNVSTRKERPPGSVLGGGFGRGGGRRERERRGQEGSLPRASCSSSTADGALLCLQRARPLPRACTPFPDCIPSPHVLPPCRRASCPASRLTRACTPWPTPTASPGALAWTA